MVTTNPTSGSDNLTHTSSVDEQQPPPQDEAASPNGGTDAAPATNYDSEVMEFSPSINHGGDGNAAHVMFSPPFARQNNDNEMMGPILRRKKVVSMPLGAEGMYRDVCGRCTNCLLQ